MSTLVDGRPLQTYSAYRGIGRYVRHIARIFGPDDRVGFLFFREDNLSANVSTPVFTASPRRMITMTDPYFLRKIFARHRTTCYHSTAYALPGNVRNVRYLLTVFDLTPLKFPHFFPFRHRLVFKRIIESAKRADIVLPISQTTASDLFDFVPIDPARIRVLHCMLDERLTGAAAEKPATSLPGDYLLYTGGADRVKNLETLFQAVSLLQIPLLIAGQIAETRMNQLLSGLPLRDRRLVTFMGYVPDAHLAYLYSHAAAFVFPSLNEGFGFPPLESMQCGTPSVVSLAGSLAEILGDSALYVDHPLDPGEWAGRIGNLLEDSELRKELINRGRRLLPKYSRAEFEKNLKNIYFESD
jgi:glycosyltransferase involved in cell wall biosynthesis